MTSWTPFVRPYAYSNGTFTKMTYLQSLRGGITLAVSGRVIRPVCCPSVSSCFRSLVVALVVVFALVGPVAAQSNASPSDGSTSNAAAEAGGAPAAPAAQAADDDRGLDLAEPDFFIVNLPTTLRLPRHSGNFRVTHRFGGNLRSGDFGDQASNLFGLDQGAVIGLEYRYAIASHVQVAFTRSSFEKTIQFSGRYDAVHQSDATPLSVSGLVSVEGPNNLRSRKTGGRARLSVDLREHVRHHVRTGGPRRCPGDSLSRIQSCAEVFLAPTRVSRGCDRSAVWFHAWDGSKPRG